MFSAACVFRGRGGVKRVLVLLIGEVLEDPRVFRTCKSLAAGDTAVTVACTNPSGRPEQETFDGLSLVRFPHRTEFFLKRLYVWLKGRLHPKVGGALARGHEAVPESSIMASLRNVAAGMNFRHYLKSSMKINRLFVDYFAGEFFDLVHCNDFDTLAAGRSLKRSGSAKELLYDSHEYWPGIGAHGSRPNDTIRHVEREGITDADYVVTVNPMIADLLRDDYGLAVTPSVVMNCPYRYDGDLALDTAHEPVRVIYQGKLQAFRGLDDLVEAFRYVDNAVLTLSGYGPLEESLKLLAASHGISDRVTVTGRYRPGEALAILARHDIGVMPFRDATVSIRLSSPNKLFDYSMAGLALAATDLPYIGKIIRDCDAGSVFEEAAPENIAAVLNRMAADRNALLRFKKNARKAAEMHYTWDHQFANYPWKP